MDRAQTLLTHVLTVIVAIKYRHLHKLELIKRERKISLKWDAGIRDRPSGKLNVWKTLSLSQGVGSLLKHASHCLYWKWTRILALKIMACSFLFSYKFSSLMAPNEQCTYLGFHMTLDLCWRHLVLYHMIMVLVH